MAPASAELDERDAWQLAPGCRRFVVRGGGTVVAFVAGSEPPSKSGFVLVGAHTDSPNLRVKPLAEVSTNGYRQLGVEVYGGVIWHTWLDRDLSIAGRVTLGQRRVATRAPRRRAVPNPQPRHPPESRGQHRRATAQRAEPLDAAARAGKKRRRPRRGLPRCSRRPSRSRSSEIVSFDLCLYDVTPACLGGESSELIFAPRLDNLASCHAALTALLAAGSTAAATRVVALYDHEEVGSQSAAGAKSRFLSSVLDRVAGAYRDAGRDATSRAFARSLMVSADMAHAVHPNYADKHDKQHAPKLGKGPVIKLNANQSYATDAPSAAVFDLACREAGTTPQRFVSRNDMPCGSTIGPISAAQMGIRTVDVGNPMLSMHSCREMAAAADVEPMISALTRLLTLAVLPKPSA